MQISWRRYLDHRAITLLLLGFLAGIPYLLIFSTLSLWLMEAGIERNTVTLFSWAALGYSFKFIWSPLIDTLSLPLLSPLGQRRSWLCLAQILIIFAIILIAWIDPQGTQHLHYMAMGAVLLGFAAATQDIIIDAYRIEIAPNNPAMQAIMSATYTAGYRLGMITSGAGSLLLAAYLGSTKTHYLYEAWRNTYLIMASMMALGMFLTLYYVREPNHMQSRESLSSRNNIRLLSIFILAIIAFIVLFRAMSPILPTPSSPIVGLFIEIFHLGSSLVGAIMMGYFGIKIGIAPKNIVMQTWLSPLSDFFHRYGTRAIILLALIGLYRISDIVSGVISNVFYADMGFSKEEIAMAVKIFGVISSIAGGIMGGVLAQRFRIMKMMMLGGIAAAATNLLFAYLATRGHDVIFMYISVGLDNFAAGLAGTIFVAFLSTLTNIRFTATQYALFSSLMTLLPKTLGGYSGSIVNHIGYAPFFFFTAALGIPILGLIVWADTILCKKDA